MQRRGTPALKVSEATLLMLAYLGFVAASNQATPAQSFLCIDLLSCFFRNEPMHFIYYIIIITRWHGPTGAVVGVSCSSLGLMCVAQSCCVINVFRVACCTFNVSMPSVVGLLTQGVDTASINQSFKQ
jgi:hypothetical protein